MKIKRFLSVLLLLVMAVSVVGCHKKDEIAVKIGDVEFTSAYYMCALINADSEAKTEVDESLSEEELSSEDFDYYSKKIDGKKYVEWVEDTAMKTLKQIAAYKTLCKEAKLEMSESEISNSEYYAAYYWNSYGYSTFFEPNGVSEKTFTQFMVDTSYSSLYFDYLYGKDGEKAVDDETVKNAIYDNFVIADTLEFSFADKTEDEITNLKGQAESFVSSIKNKTMTFEEVYNVYNGITEEDATDDTASDEAKPADEYASVLGAKDTGYDSDYYDEVKAMAVGEVKLIEQEDNAGLILVVKQDIKADSYYLDELDIPTRHLLKDDDFEEYIDSYIKDLSVDVDKYAIGQFKVKKIKYPE